MTLVRLTRMCGRIGVTDAALAFFLSTGALAQDEAPETEAPPGAKGASSALKPTIVNLVFKSVDLVGKPVDLGSKPGTLGGKPADVGGKVEDLAIKETETEVRIELSGDILFDFDKATLRTAAEPILTRVAEVIRKYGKPDRAHRGAYRLQGLRRLQPEALAAASRLGQRLAHREPGGRRRPHDERARQDQPRRPER